MNKNVMPVVADEEVSVYDFIHILNDKEFNNIFKPVGFADEENDDEKDIVKDAMRDCMEDYKLCLSNVEEIKLVTCTEAERSN